MSANTSLPETSAQPICDLSVLQSKLVEYGQDHILEHWDDLNDQQQAELAEQVQNLDLEQIEKLFHKFSEPNAFSADPENFDEPVGFGLNDSNPRFTKEEAIAAGESLLRAGTVGVVIVAGGQGTRLGFAHPKGMFPIGPLSDCSLFEILLTKAKAVSSKYGYDVPVYLMTSPATHGETVQFLNENNRFGLSEDQLVVFCQGTMPAVDINTGKLMLEEKHSLFRSPDGHGGMLAGLQNNHAFEHMKKHGIEHLFYMQIDNALVDVAAPEAIGYHVLSNSDATTMVIRKTNPLEKVGNVAVIDEKTQIVEYSDVPDSVAKLKRDDGSLLLWAGNVAVHVWDVSFLESVATSSEGLPFHFAKKKVPFVDANGDKHKPEEPNGIKFERFIFDLLPTARRAIVVEVDRDSYFAPLKNPSGSESDSPETVKEQIASLHKQWIESTGAKVADGVTIEIQPSYAANPEELAEKIGSQDVFDKNQILK